MFYMYIPSRIEKVMNALEKNGHEVYIVGGAIRNTLLNQKVKDYDLATTAKADEIYSSLREFNLINNNGPKHNTITVRIDSDNVEVTSFKKAESEKNSIEVDLSHRDFTVNAMAYHPQKGLIDPFNGRKSIKEKEIVTVLDSMKRFNEDPLRILRAIRFSSLYDFSINEYDLKVMNQLAHKLNEVAKERIKAELEGIMIGKNIRDILLKHRNIFGQVIPELIPTFDFNQNHRCHIHDVYTHICYVVGYTKNDFRLRMAALFHDIAKPNCFTQIMRDGSLQGRFLGHPEEGSKIAINIMKRLKFSSSEIEEIVYLIINHDGLLPSTKKAVKKMIAKAPNQSFEIYKKLIDLKNADRSDHLYLDGVKVDELISIGEEIIRDNECLKITDLKITGYELMNLGLSGKEIGDALKYLLQKVLDDEIKNSKECLFEEIKRYLNI